MVVESSECPAEVRDPAPPWDVSHERRDAHPGEAVRVHGSTAHEVRRGHLPAAVDARTAHRPRPQIRDRSGIAPRSPPERDQSRGSSSSSIQSGVGLGSAWDGGAGSGRNRGHSLHSHLRTVRSRRSVIPASLVRRGKPRTDSCDAGAQNCRDAGGRGCARGTSPWAPRRGVRPGRRPGSR